MSNISKEPDFLYVVSDLSSLESFFYVYITNHGLVYFSKPLLMNSNPFDVIPEKIKFYYKLQMKELFLILLLKMEVLLDN